MGRSQETFNKKEKEKKRLQKKKEKEQRKEARQENSDKGKGLDDMLAYVDEYGNLSSTPPDPNRLKKEVNAEEILISIPRLEDQGETDTVRKGRVSYFNNSKGYGFVTDDTDGERIFIHVNDLPGPVTEDTRLQFMVKKGVRGLQATDIEIIG